MTIFDSSILAFAVEFAISHFYLSFSWKKQKESEREREEKRREEQIKIERVHGICVLLHHVSMRILKNVQAFYMVMKFMY